MSGRAYREFSLEEWYNSAAAEPSAPRANYSLSEIVEAFMGTGPDSVIDENDPAEVEAKRKGQAVYDELVKKAAVSYSDGVDRLK